MRSARDSAKVWALRILFFAGLTLLCALAGSGDPALAFCVICVPNVLFLAAFLAGVIHLPRTFEAVHPAEPLLYRRLGVGLVKRIAASRLYPMVVGSEPWPRIRNRPELLDRAEITMKVAEISHGVTLVLTIIAAIGFFSVGMTSMAAWILVLNVPFNAYPVMLQRSNRWRMQRLRAMAQVATNATRLG